MRNHRVTQSRPFIQDQQVIREILQPLKILLVISRPPLKIYQAITLFNRATFDSLIHVPHPPADAYAHPQYAWDDYIQS